MNGRVFVERIDDSLKRINKKRQALAEYCGVTVQSISDWARRGNLPQADTTKRIADFLGVSIELLVDDDYQTQWNEVVDEDTKQAIVSPCEICYRIDSLIKEKSTVSVQDSDDIFYAEILDIFSVAQIYAMKNNQYEPTNLQLFKVAKRYGVSLDWLISGTLADDGKNLSPHLAGLAGKYTNLLKFYNSLPESDKKAVYDLIVHIFHSKRRIREHLVDLGMDVKDVPDLII